MSTQPYVKGYSYPCYPTPEQRQLLAKTFGCCRYVYNRRLAEAQSEYQNYFERKERDDDTPRPGVSGYDHSTHLPRYKADPNSQWLAEVSSVALQQSLLRLGQAYARFFKGKGKTGYPRFKRKIDKQSFRLVGGAFRLDGNRLYIARCSTPLKVVFTRPLPSQPTSLTLTLLPTGQYRDSFTCRYTPVKRSGTGVVGLDLGLTDFLTLSDGTKVPNPKYLLQRLKQLRRANQTHARKQKGSKNKEKSRRQLARCHARVAHSRNDYHHQLSRRLVNENQVIGIEDLTIVNMVRNRHLSRGISDAGWGRFLDLLNYKAVESQNCTIVKAESRWYPSSKRCHVCYHIHKALTLRERQWTCEQCGSLHDRDINAALNLKAEALRILSANGIVPGTIPHVIGYAEH